MDFKFPLDDLKLPFRISKNTVTLKELQLAEDKTLEWCDPHLYPPEQALHPRVVWWKAWTRAVRQPWSVRGSLDWAPGFCRSGHPRRWSHPKTLRREVLPATKAELKTTATVAPFCHLTHWYCLRFKKNKELKKKQRSPLVTQSQGR